MNDPITMWHREHVRFVRLLDFVVYGTRPGPGRVAVEADVEAIVERDHAERTP